VCKICSHPQRTAIDRAIAAGDSCRMIATMFATSKDAVYRHKTGCMQNLVPTMVTLPAYQTSSDVATTKQTVTTVLQRVSSLIDVLEKQANECSNDKDRRNMTATATALLKALELNAKLTGELDCGGTKVQVNVGTPSITTCPEWGIVIRVLDRHPEIRQEMVEELQRGNHE
jgi:hypothetical protein